MEDFKIDKKIPLSGIHDISQLKIPPNKRSYRDMNIREYCAIKMLQGIVSNHNFEFNNHKPSALLKYEELCQRAIELTDELFRQLEEKPSFKDAVEKHMTSVKTS